MTIAVSFEKGSKAYTKAHKELIVDVLEEISNKFCYTDLVDVYYAEASCVEDITNILEPLKNTCNFRIVERIYDTIIQITDKEKK